MIESVPNLSEGRDAARLARLADSVAGSGAALLDVHSDPVHHRSVFTLAGPDAPGLLDALGRLARRAVDGLDLTGHTGVHPRLGVLDVVPFVPLEPGPAAWSAATEARRQFAQWAGRHLDLPCFLYGPERPLPQVRREAFGALAPDFGPPSPHPSAGAVAVGVRAVMIAYNLWLSEVDMAAARRMAGALRDQHVRALAFDLGGQAQLSFNLLSPAVVGPAEIYDRAVAAGAVIERAELVGLAPASVLAAVPSGRWAELGLDPADTIEARVAARRSSPGG